MFQTDTGSGCGRREKVNLAEEKFWKEEEFR
jgi:hypothetical protein